MTSIRLPHIAAFLTILLLLLIPGAAMAGVDSVYPSQDSPPTHIASHEVMQIRNSDNTPCYPSDAPPTVTLAASAPGLENLLSSGAPNMAAIKQDLQSNGFPEGTRVSMTGPGITKAMVKKIQDKANAHRRERGCIQFGKLDDAVLDDTVLDSPGQSTGPAMHSHLNPGYSVIMDTEITGQGNHNGQSVILTAPTIGNNQDNFSAFLNNGYTNAIPGWLLQNGLLFDGSVGSVVWTDERYGLNPVDYTMSYVVDHDYYFTISYTNSLWWLCASDRTVGSSTYECVNSPSTEGTRLTRSVNTSVWFENQNTALFWFEGFSTPAIAHTARNYVNGVESYWSHEKQFTIICGDRYDDDGANQAIEGELKNNGTAEFVVYRVPLGCG